MLFHLAIITLIEFNQPDIEVMPRADNEWGEWDETQYQVRPRPTWLELILSPKKYSLLTNVSLPQAENASFFCSEGVYSPCLKDLRDWYHYAREIKRHEGYLEYIKILGEEFKVKTLGAEENEKKSNSNIYLSDADLSNMEDDRRHYQELLERFFEYAKTILDRCKSAENFDKVKVCRYSFKSGEYTLSYYLISGRLTVEKKDRFLAFKEAKHIGEERGRVQRQDVEFFYRIAYCH